MTVAWGGICCSQPPCLAISLQKPRYSYEGIVQHQAFTVNIPSVSQVREADYAGTCSGREEDKLAVLGLTPVRSDVVDAPYLREFPVVMECKVVRTIELGMHTEFVGEILDVKAEESMLGDSGLPDLDKVQPFLFEPGHGGYYRVGEFVGQAFSIGKKE